VSKAEQKRRQAFFENARFFKYLPERTVDSLTQEQRRDIAFTIFELQRSNPRIIQELYLDNPFVNAEQGSKLGKLFKRRIYLTIRTLWYSLVVTKDENRRSNRLADMLFAFILALMTMIGLFGIVMALYFTKSAAGIDLMPGMHFFCTQ